MVREAARTWLRLQGAQLPIPPCHSEEHSDEESREQNTVRSHTGSFAHAQDDSYFLRSIRAVEDANHYELRRKI